jgi:hypothetical protein
MKTKNLFKVTFESGKTYYGLHQVKTTQSFIKTNIGLAKFHLENPHIHTITNFEQLLLDEKFVCELINSGEIEEMAKVKDILVETDKMSINYKKSVTEKKKLEKNPPILVKKDYIKTLKNSKGEILHFIDKNFGISRGYTDGMKFAQVHPLKSNFCLITSNIKLV